MPYTETAMIKSAKFVLSAPDISFCPKSILPEFAFIGRSNVGKSSLINLICDRKNLALVSKTPGKTKLINFFNIDDKWHLVDLPGYGYAKISKDKRKTWLESTQNYLLQRPNLKIIFTLIDASIPPQAIDLDFISWLDHCHLQYALVFTKADKVNQKELNQNMQIFLDKLTEMGIKIPLSFTTAVSKKHSKDRIVEYISNETELKQY